MKKVVLVLVVLVILFSGCLEYFEEAEKTTKVFIQEEKVAMEIKYEGKLTEKGKMIEDCEKEMEKVFPSVQASLEANINDPDEQKRKEVKAKLELLKEIKKSFECTLKKENGNGKLTVKFETPKEMAKRLGELMPKEGFGLGDANETRFFLKMMPETKDFFASKVTKENILIKVEGEVIEVKPSEFSIKEGFIQFYDTNSLDANYIEVYFRKEEKLEIPFLLVAVSFIIVIAVIVIGVIWTRRKPEDLFPKSEKEIIEKMKKVLVNGLGTTEIKILSIEKTGEEYEIEAMIKTRKYHIVFNKKIELKEYVKI